MKLSQIQETRYDSDHPIIVWIKEFVRKSMVGDHNAYPLESEKQAVQAAEAITKEFGNQITVPDWPVTEWNIEAGNKVIHIQVDHKHQTVDVSRYRRHS